MKYFAMWRKQSCVWPRMTAWWWIARSFCMKVLHILSRVNPFLRFPFVLASSTWTTAEPHTDIATEVNIPSRQGPKAATMLRVEPQTSKFAIHQDIKQFILRPNVPHERPGMMTPWTMLQGYFNSHLVHLTFRFQLWSSCNCWSINIRVMLQNLYFPAGALFSRNRTRLSTRFCFTKGKAQNFIFVNWRRFQKPI